MQKVTVVSLALGLAVLALASLAMAATEAAVRASPSFKQGDASVVAVYITNRPYNCTHLDPPNITFCNDSKLAANWTNATDIHLKSVFMPVTDSMTRIEIPGTYQFATNGSWADAEIYLETYCNGTAYRTSRKKYFNANYVVGSWSAYIKLNKGVVTGFAWDDGCSECGGSQCITDDCGISKGDDCNKDTKTGTKVCDMKFYIGWLGADNNGWQCLSAGELPSNLRVYSLGSVFKDAAGVPTGQFIFDP